MCIYGKLIRNKKYVANKKNGGNPPPVIDKRTAFVPMACGKCMECKKRKSREYQVRLSEEIRNKAKAEFVTLTFSNEEYTKLLIEAESKFETKGYELDNDIASLAVRRFTERWRHFTGKAPRHWLITELGHQGTENIHMHGIIWTEEKDKIEERWKYGYVYIGQWVNEQTVNYIVKYVTKADKDHKEYNAKVFASKGIGADYTEREDGKRNRYKGEETREYYTTRTGVKLPLPIYYRNKIYSEEEREKLWIKKLEKDIRYVDGEKIDISKTMEGYWKAVERARIKNKRLGYGDNEADWDRKEYEENRREMLQQERMKNKAWD